MAIFCRRIYYKYIRYLVTIVLVIFFAQIMVAVYLFPSESGPKNRPHTSSRQDLAVVSARKVNVGFEDDEDFAYKNSKIQKHVSLLRLEELDFKPPCDIVSREAISAVHRAKTQLCKKQIVNLTCLIQEGNFYPNELPNSCADKANANVDHLGCYQDEKKLRLLSSFYGNFANANTPSTCIDLCVQAGFPFAGVQYASECFCGENFPPATFRVDDSLCDMKCPGDPLLSCGGYFTMNIYQTGLLKFEPRVPIAPRGGDKPDPVRIIFLLTLNGRALRQVHRLLNALYRTNHYFYIHVDARQDYLHRKLTELESKFPNIKLAKQRFATIWGGASLLQMLLASMKEFFALNWQWDYVINLSESDFPIKSLESLELFLSKNKGLNFVKSHGREVQRFIKKQGLDKTFLECETHMWRLGARRLPRGLIVDGGSDWLALSPAFVAYVAGEASEDALLRGLRTLFRHTLLPAESFFHTALRNSRFCNTYVDNNLHVTNWKRKLGCKCQYKHVVDWCGCSPNDFRVEDWPRIQNTQDRQLFFARKFEPVISQEIITRVEKSIGFNDHHLLENLESYWQSIYDSEDAPASTDDILRSHAGSLARLAARRLRESGCGASAGVGGGAARLASYSRADLYRGNLVLHRTLMDAGLEAPLETWYEPQHSFTLTRNSPYIDNVKIFRVSSDYDQKEVVFRNFANILGPLSEPVLLYQLSPPLENSIENFTVVWVDPAGLVADLNEIHLDENNLTNFIKPNLKVPLLPGIWRVGLIQGIKNIVQTKFLISPLEYFSGKHVTVEEANIIHSGSQSHYKNISKIVFTGLVPSYDESFLLQQIAKSNSKRVQEDLREWIDSLNNMFYSIQESCINVSTDTTASSFQCGEQELKLCSHVEWSSFSPDPKGHIGKVNLESGRLQRV